MINHFTPFFVLRSNATQALRANVRGARSRLPKAKAFGTALCTALLLIPSLASAQQVLTLKGAPQSGDGSVTVGDVFDNAGPIAGVVLGYRNGPTAFLDTATVQSVVGANGGYWANPRGQRRIIVTAVGAGTAPNRRQVQVQLQPQVPAQVRAAAAPVQLVAQPANPFITQAQPPAPAAVQPAPAPALVAAAQPAPAVRGPVVVHRLETIDVTWSATGIALTMSGIVQKDAATGDTVAIQNPTSKKMIDAVITGPGHAIAGPGADQYRAATLQLSSR